MNAFSLHATQSTVEPPNKGHVGDDNINSDVLSFVERLFSFVNIIEAIERE